PWPRTTTASRLTGRSPAGSRPPAATTAGGRPGTATRHPRTLSTRAGTSPAAARREAEMGLVRYRPNRQGIRDLLGSPAVGGMLFEKALKVAAAAEAEYTARPPHSGQVEVVTTLSKERIRWRAAVIA